MTLRRRLLIFAALFGVILLSALGLQAFFGTPT